MYIKTALFSPPYSCLTYKVAPGFPDEFWRPGLRVAVPVGGSIRSACILSTDDAPPDNIRCRDIIFPLESSPLIGADLLGLAIELGRRQARQPGYVLGHILPHGLRQCRVRIRWVRNGKASFYELNDIRSLANGHLSELSKALLQGDAAYQIVKRDSGDCEVYSAAIDPPWPLRPAAARQIAVMDYLYENGAVTRTRLYKALGSGTAAPLRRLCDLGFVKAAIAEEAPGYRLSTRPEPEFELNSEQSSALARLVNTFGHGRSETSLLYGITGSGKTAIYLELAKVVLQAGRSVILLAPEVALACKLFGDVDAALPDVPRFLYHGYQLPSARESIFRAVASENKPHIIVGTRSALFLPVRDPGCIILDEEHDSSYKQDDGLAYHAKEVAWFRASQNKSLLVLGSATPDIRTFHAGKSGSFPVHGLKSRVSGASLPAVELARLAEKAAIAPEPNEGGLLAPESEAALKECLQRQEQAVILLNRRGYAPVIFCLGCNKTLRCPHCEIGMAYHKSAGRLVCHYCGYSLSWPAPCPECGCANYITIGEGTERMAERLEAIAGRSVLRLDRDSARRPETMEGILRDFAAGKSPFLVGTQMLSKGHHFPNVTCVIIADGDLGLNLPDYRAAEKSFQLLVQSAGRAGRGSKPGRALIQTRNPDHYCWRYIRDYDYEGFYETELGLREKYRYPPFIRLGLLRISFPDGQPGGQAACAELGQSLRSWSRNLGMIFLGPAPAPLAMLKGRRRFQCLLKASEWKPMRELWGMAQRHPSAKYLRIALDLDPVNML